MSQYTPAVLGVADLEAIRAPYLGGEFKIYLSHTPAKHIGTLDVSAPTVGVYTDDVATSLTAVTGDDIQIVARTPLAGAGSSVITFAGLDDTGTPIAMNGVATIGPPAYVPDQSFYFPRGWAADLVPAVGGKKFTGITSFTSITNGTKNSSFDLYVLPSLTTGYILVGCTMDADFGLKSQKALGIDCNLETDAYVKLGKTTPGDLSFGSKFKGIAFGVSRFAGQRCTCMIEGRKNGQILTDRYVFTGFVPTVTPTAPEGEGEATEKVEGKFEEVLFFPAPYA